MKRSVSIFLSAYAVVLAMIAPGLSLWLDEILTVAGATQPDLTSLIGYLKTVPGGTALAFLIPRWTFELLGYSSLTARLPSMLASLAACGGVYILARRAGMKQPLFAVGLFAVLPLQFRYAMEARPYALALCLSIWTTVLFFALLENPQSVWRILLYGVLTVAGGLTLAYSLFVPAAHLAWLVSVKDRRNPLPAVIAVSIAAAGGSLIPWYLYFSPHWQLVTQQQQLAFWNWRAFLVFFHELAGTGYIGTGVLLIGAGLGLRRVVWPRFWLAYAVIPALLVPLANIVFGYFFAIRQVIYILAPLAVLFVFGADSLGRKGRLILAALIAASVYEDVNGLSKPRENWDAAASSAISAIESNGCVQYVPDDAHLTYEFFQPSLRERQCSPEYGDTVVLAISPYDPRDAYGAARTALRKAGYAQGAVKSFDGPRTEVYKRTTAEP